MLNTTIASLPIERGPPAYFYRIPRRSWWVRLCIDAMFCVKDINCCHSQVPFQYALIAIGNPLHPKFTE